MNIKSVYKYAAEAGVPVGIYLTLISGCFLLSVKYEFLSMLIFPLVVVFPIVLGCFMRRLARVEPAYARFSPMWLFGIYSVLAGTLICSLFSALYLMFVDPNFMKVYVENAIATIEASPMAGEYSATVDMMRQAIDAHMLPSGLQLVTTMGWFTCFSGSILSLFLSLILSQRKPKERRGLNNA